MNKNAHSICLCKGLQISSGESVLIWLKEAGWLVAVAQNLPVRTVARCWSAKTEHRAAILRMLLNHLCSLQKYTCDCSRTSKTTSWESFKGSLIFQCLCTPPHQKGLICCCAVQTVCLPEYFILFYPLSVWVKVRCFIQRTLNYIILLVMHLLPTTEAPWRHFKLMSKVTSNTITTNYKISINSY